MLLLRSLRFQLLIFCAALSPLCGDNQTDTVSPVVTNGNLPYQVVIEQESFNLPSGVHSFASAVYDGKWVILAGRTNGLHNFENNNNNFPPSSQNDTVFVIDPSTGTVYTRTMTTASSQLTQAQIDTLTVTSPQSYHTSKTLYISGGYGVDTESGTFGTKPVFTAIDLKGLVHWTMNSSDTTLLPYIRQVTNSTCQVTGGFMRSSNKDLTLLIFGQNFDGYYLPGSNGDYTRQVRRFKINDSGSKLSLHIKDPIPETPNSNYRRRDLNVVPVIHHLYGTALPAYVAFSGVFTESGGAWTVPVLVDYWGNSTMADPSLPSTFKQAMNNYASAFAGLYSKEAKTMFVTLFGGISFGYFENDVFMTDSGLPFINQVTTVTLDKEGTYTQYLMDNEYPVILSTGSNPGNQLLFGAGAKFFLADGIPTYDNGVIKLDKLGYDPIVIGYIVGGIMSTLPNTAASTDSTASPYIFRVVLQPTA